MIVFLFSKRICIFFDCSSTMSSIYDGVGYRCASTTCGVWCFDGDFALLGDCDVFPGSAGSLESVLAHVCLEVGEVEFEDVLVCLEFLRGFDAGVGDFVE